MSTAPVLIVEDDASLAHAVARNLTARGYVVRSTGTVEEALAALQERTPAFVLLDIDLPDGSGWDVLRTLRASGHHEVGVIVMSALRPNARLSEELGCVAHLEKPFPMESLLRLVAHECRRADVPALDVPDPDSLTGADASRRP
jgi:two-component system KDP operon response regulator KdpE